jgi:hypothetical protein
VRVQRVSYGSMAIGKTGIILSHSNNTLHIKLDDGPECDDLYWSWIPLDDEAKEYIEEVERTATPMTSELM